MAQDYPDPYEPEPRRGRTWVQAVALLLVLALVAGAAYALFQWWQGRADDPAAQPTSSESETTDVPGPEDPGLQAFYDQRLEWRDCSGNQCARFDVPLDYDEPQGERIKIAVLKVPAARKNARIGSLVVNPGGPGGSGIEYASAGSLQFGSRIASAYDIVGFDPRGVGESTAIDCLGTTGMDALVSFDPDPDDEQERDRLDELINDFGQGCVDNSGELAEHISTVEVARDMDVLRALLREDKLDYMGASYGTFLGATYADLFPQHVGRFVLDGAVDPSLSNKQLSLEQAEGFETALRAYVQDCVDQGDCYLGDSVEEGTAAIRAFFDQLERQPLPTGEDRDLTAGLGMIGTWLPLYVKAFWTQLTDAMRAAMEEGNGSGLLALADLYLSRGTDEYTDNSMEVLYAVNCLDHNDYIETDEVPSHFDEFEEASPTFGRAFAFSLSTCSQWPIKSGNKTTALDAAGAPPIVVVGTTRDPATPLRWSVALADQLESGRLITRDGDGHTGFNQGNECVDSAVENFLLAGTVPPEDLKC